jgi:hypothetical protein
MRTVSEETQIIVTTHSPDFVRGLKPEEVFMVDKKDEFSDFVEKKYEELGREIDRLRAKNKELPSTWIGLGFISGYYAGNDGLETIGNGRISIYRTIIKKLITSCSFR